MKPFLFVVGVSVLAWTNGFSLAKFSRGLFFEIPRAEYYDIIYDKIQQHM